MDPFALSTGLASLCDENARLRREVEHLRATARLMLDEPDAQRLARSLARHAGELLAAEEAAILVLRDTEVIAHGRWRRRDPAFTDLAAPAFQMGIGAAGLAARRLQPCVIHEAASYVLAAPILDHQHRLVGVLEATDARSFTAEELRVAQTLAMQSAIGLERARLFDTMREWTQSLETLLSFNAAINQHLDPPRLVRRLVEHAARFLKADGGMAGLALPSTARAGIEMRSDAYWHRGAWHERTRRWEMNEGLPGFLLESEFPYIANEYTEDRFADPELVAAFGVSRALCVPIKDTQNIMVGFFEVHKSGGQPPFTWQDAAFLESLGNTTAVAIQNAQLLKSLEIKNEEIQSLSAHNVQRLEEERAHIARELHDEAGQMLIGIKLGLQVLARRFGEDAVPLREELDRLRELVNHSTAQIKNIARRLRPPILDQLGLHVTLRQLSADFSDFTGIVVDCQLEAIPERLPAAAEIALYRIAQEALTNAARHAQATQVELQLWLDHPLLHFSVRDNGVGFVDGSTSRGLGLLGMRERAEMLNAIFSLRTGRGEGTLITVSIPYETDHPC